MIISVRASMYFHASKIIGFFAVPSNLIPTLTICGLLLWRTRFAKFGMRLTERRPCSRSIRTLDGNKGPLHFSKRTQFMDPVKAPASLG